jgi:hypothetical protein
MCVRVPKHELLEVTWLVNCSGGAAIDEAQDLTVPRG